MIWPSVSLLGIAVLVAHLRVAGISVCSTNKMGAQVQGDLSGHRHRSFEGRLEEHRNTSWAPLETLK